MDEAFATAEDLKEWLVRQRVSEPDAAEAAPALFQEGYATSNYYLSISREELDEAGLAPPLSTQLLAIFWRQRLEREEAFLSRQLDRAFARQQAENQSLLHRQQAENQSLLHRLLSPVGENIQTVGENIQRLLDYQEAEEKKLVISAPKTRIFNDFLAQLDLTWTEAQWSDKPDFEAPPDPYQWHDSIESSPMNKEGYMNYLENNITLPGETHLLDASKDQDLLSGPIEGLLFTGNVDVVLNPRGQKLNMRQHILMAIELKKDSNTEDAEINRQVISQHLAASYWSHRNRVLTMMTDLNDRWNFYWFAERAGKMHMMIYEATRSEALYLIEHSQDREGTISTPESFLTRSSWNLSRQLGSIAEEPLDDGPDPNNGGPDPNREPDENERRSDGNAGRQRETGTKRPSIHQSGRSSGKRSKQTQMQDSTLEFMDEEERREAELRAILQATLPRMFYIPKVEERPSENGIPGEISW